MGSREIESIRGDYPDMSDSEAAKAFAAKYGYIAIVRYKNSTNASDFTNIGTCATEAEIRGYLTSPYCHGAEVIYDGRSALFPLNTEHVLKGRCEMCGKHSTPDTLQIGAGNDFYFCPKCGLLFCDGCYVRLPLTSSPGYGMCPKCKLQVKRAIPDFFVAGSGGPREAGASLTQEAPQTHMNWYQTEDAKKSVRQIVIEIPPGNEKKSQFGMLFFGAKYLDLMSKAWTAGFFRLDGNPGPYFLVRADKAVSKLRGSPIRVAFSFYRMKAGGLVAIFVDVDCPEVRAKLTYPHVLFEMVYGLDMADTKSLVQDAIGRETLHLCFAEGDGPGKMSGGVFESSAINAKFDVVVPLAEDCRAALKRELEGILSYHASIAVSRRDFQQSGRQMEAENPQTENPILPRLTAGGRAAPSGQTTTNISVSKRPSESEPAPLSEGARIVDTFFAPSKTFTDLRRNSSWWAPWLLISIATLAFLFVVGRQIGFEQIARNQIAHSSKADQFDKLPADQQERQIHVVAAFTRYISYATPINLLIAFLLMAVVLWATFKVAAGSDVRFGTAMAIVAYGSLPGLIGVALGIVSLLAGVDREGFNINNPVATNPAYFMDPAGNKFFYGMVSALDIFVIWNIILMGIGFATNSKVKRTNAILIVAGWYVFWKLLAAGLAVATS